MPIHADHDNDSKLREVDRNIPIAWQKLIEEQDSILVDLISKKIADLFGYKPNPDQISSFLIGQS